MKKRTPLKRKRDHPRRAENPWIFPTEDDIKKEPIHVRVMADGKERCNMLTKQGRDEYGRRVREMWERQGRKCGLQIASQCKERNGRLLINEAQFEHSMGRGMGGAKRDDRIVDDDGKPMNMAVCGWCNMLKGSRPVTDFDLYI